MARGSSGIADETTLEGERATTGVPRWVKVSGLGGILLVALVVAAMLIGGGEHGPGRHLPGGDGGAESAPPGAEGHTPPANLPEGHTPPPGGHP